MKDIVPIFFSQESKYKSFTLQLNGRGFKKLHQSGVGVWLQCVLSRTISAWPTTLDTTNRTRPQNQGKFLPFVEGEPNFYEFDKNVPLVRPPWSLTSISMFPCNQGHSSHTMSGGGSYRVPSQIHGDPPSNPPPQYPTQYHSHQQSMQTASSSPHNTTASSSPFNTNGIMSKILTSTPCTAQNTDDYGWYLLTFHCRATVPVPSRNLMKQIYQI